MRDKFASSRLPDLPIAGYATPREKLLTDTVMTFLRSAERNRLLLLSMVCDGPVKFRKVVKKAWRFLKADDELVDATYGYLVLLAGPNPTAQLDTLLRMADMSQVQRVRHVTGMQRMN